jgi:hypothetical protein
LLSLASILRSKLLRSRKTLTCIMLIILCGCGTADPPNWKDIVAPSRVSTNPAKTTDQLVVYLDTSASMKGYVSPDGKVKFASLPDGQTVFSHTLIELRNVVTSLTPPVNVILRRVDSTVGSLSFNDLGLSQASLNRSTYNGKETDLAGAIALFSKDIQTVPPASNYKGETLEHTPARFHILVTDGVQSTRKQRLDMSCASGSDYVCVKNTIANLLRNNWAGIILGIKSEFRGDIYSEIDRGRVVFYESHGNDSRTFRPFYLYIFSPDPVALAKLVEELKSRLQAKFGGEGTILGREDLIRQYTITSAYSDGAPGADISIPEESRSYLEKTKARDGEPPRFTLRVDLDTEKTGAKPFLIHVTIPWTNHARAVGTTKELLGLLKWELVPVYPAEGGSRVNGQTFRYPEIKIAEPLVETNGEAILKASAQWPPGVGVPGWRAYRLEGRIDVSKPIPQWVQDWSTDLDTKSEMGSKTLNLESALSGLWRNSILEKYSVAEVYIRVGPK